MSERSSGSNWWRWPVSSRLCAPAALSIVVLYVLVFAGDASASIGGLGADLGFAAGLVRGVEVAQPSSSSAALGAKLAALTFDDGPSVHTRQIVAILSERGVPATFFFVGGTVGGYPGLATSLRDAGFEVENHTWGHADLTGLAAGAILSQIERTNAVLGPCRFMRPPMCRFDSRVTSAVHKAGMELALWNVDTLDWRDRDAARILARVKAGTKPGAVILMHDGGGDRSQTVAALPLVIDWLLAQGYTLVRLDELGAAAMPGTFR